MWYLRSVEDKNKEFLLLPEKEYVVGRGESQCDITVIDPSASRQHAILSVTHTMHNVANVNTPAVLHLKDKSKFGTYVNGQRIDGGHLLQHGDEVSFGRTISAKFKVQYKPLIVTTSCLDTLGKKEARSLVYQLGGHILSDWQKNCSLLVMKSVTVTIKVVCALVSGKPIVSLGYLRELVNFHTGKSPEKPQLENYLPPVTEKLIEPAVSFRVDDKRSEVFLGMSFYFLSSAQFQKMNQAVELGGGVPMLAEGPGDADLESLVEDNAVVMEPGPAGNVSKGSKESAWVEKVRAFLANRGKFMVQDSEIGYAALYASTLTYCNPDRDITHLLSSSLPSHSLSQAPTQSSQLPPPSASARAEEERSSSHSQPFLKPRALVPTSAKTAVTGRGSATSRDAELSSQKSQVTATTTTRRGKDTEDFPSEKADAAFTQPRVSRDEKEEKVFAVPETLTEEGSVKLKRETEVGADSYQTNPSLFDFDSPPKKSGKPVGVKVEEGESRAEHKASGDAGRMPASENFTDVEMVLSVKKEKDSQERKPIFLLDDEEDDVVQVKKPPPSKNKRKFRKLSDDGDNDDDDDPFDFVKKRARKTSPQETGSSEPEVTRPSSRPASSKRASCSAESKQSVVVVPDSEASDKACNDDDDDDDVNPFDAVSSKKRRAQNRGRRSPSPAPSSKKIQRKSPPPQPTVGSSDPKNIDGSCSEAQAFSEKETPSKRSPSRKSTKRDASADQADVAESSKKDDSAVEGPESDVLSAPVPDGFLTTRKPMEDQVPINPHFERENIGAPAVVVRFEDLVFRRRGDRQTATEDQTGVPDGMVRWKGKVVTNFKKFKKTHHAGADRLPTIIGGRDLEEHCASSNQMLEEWLKDLSEAESQQQEREREAQQLFDFRPSATRGKKTRR